MDLTLKKKKLNDNTSTTWYSNDLIIQRNKLNPLYKRQKLNPDNFQYRIEYKTARTSYKKIHYKAKIDSWQSFCNTYSSAYGAAFKLMKKKYLRNTDLNHSVLEPCNHSGTFFDIQHSLLAFHFGTQPPEGIHTFRNSHDFRRNKRFQNNCTRTKILHILIEEQESTRIRQN